MHILKTVTTTSLRNLSVYNLNTDHHKNLRLLTTALATGLVAVGIGAISPTAAAQSIGVLVTERNPDSQALSLRGAAIEQDGVFVARGQSAIGLPTVTEFATATTIPFETSLLGVPQPIGADTVGVPPGTRAQTLQDFVINSALQNPSVTTGIVTNFEGGVTNGPGADFLVIELSPPAGALAPSGGPTVLGGDPFLVTDPDGGGNASFFAGDYEQFGGNGFSGSSTFFAADGTPFASLAELEAGDIIAVATVPGLNAYAVAVDLSDLGVAEGATISTLQFNSIAASGFGPDFGVIGALGAASNPAIVDGALQLSEFGTFTSDFDLQVTSPQGGTPLFTTIDAPLFTTLSVDTTDPLVQNVTGDFLLDGSFALTTQAASVGTYVTGLLEGNSNDAIIATLEAIDGLGTAGLEAGLLQLSPEPFATAPVLLSVEEADAKAQALRHHFSSLAQENRAVGTVSFWGDGYALFQDQEGDPLAGTSGVDPDIYGGVAGVDYQLTPWLTIGAMGGYSQGSAGFDDRFASVDLDTISVGGYALATYGQWRLGLAGGYGFGDTESIRSFSASGLTNSARADFDSDQIYGYGELAYTHEIFGVKVEPAVGFVFINVDRQGFDEVGGDGFALTVEEGDKINTLFFEPQLNLEKTYSSFGYDWRLFAHGGYRYDILDEDVSVSAALIGAPASAGSITAISAPRERGAALAGGGMSVDLSDSLELFVRYEGLWGDVFTSHDVAGGVRYAF